MLTRVIKKGHSSDIKIEEVMEHCRIDNEEEKPLLTAYLDAAFDIAERQTNRMLSESTVIAVSVKYQNVFTLPYGELGDVSRVGCIDAAGNVIEVTDYEVDYISGDVYVPYRFSDHHSFTFTFTCGYQDGTLPKAIKQGILMTVMTLYNTREDVTYGVNAMKVPKSSEGLFRLFRIPSQRMDA